MSYSLGIDLGTTFTAAATVIGGRAEVAPLGHSSLTVPSLVYVREDRSTLVGQASARRAASDPEGLARDFKRRMGDPVPLLLRGTPYAPEQLTGSLLRWVIDTVVERQGESPDSIALSHPANWTEFQRSLLRGATQIAGVTDAAMVTEPEAAAIAYATTRQVDPGRSVAVYDLGGGTFDAAVLRRRDDGNFELVGTPQGIDRLGGIDFDLAVLGWVERALKGDWGDIDRNDQTMTTAMHTLRNECVAAKEDLSSDVETRITVLLPGLQRELRLTRTEFEDMIRPSLALTVGALQRTIASAELDESELDAVLLVGGSSRIPLVAEMVAASVGVPTVTDAHPKFAIALGAALWAAHETSGRTRIPGEPAVRELAMPVTPANRVDPDDRPDRPTVEVKAPTAAVEERHRAAAPVDEPLDGGATEPGDPRRSRLAVVAVASIVAVALGALAFFALSDRGGDAGSAAPTTVAPLSSAAGATSTTPSSVDAAPADLTPTERQRAMIDAASAQEGKPVDAAAEPGSTDTVPAAFSPGGLVRWAAGVAGIELDADPAQLYLDLAAAGTLLPVDVALDTPGAIVFAFPFEPVDGAAPPTSLGVGVSLGDGRVVSADVEAGLVVLTDAVGSLGFAGVPAELQGAPDVEVPEVFATISRQLETGPSVIGVGATDSIVLVANGRDPGAVVALDPTTLEEIGSVLVDPSGGALADLVIVDGVGWVSAPSVPAIARIDIDPGGTLTATSFPTEFATGGIDASDGQAYSSGPSRIAVIDPSAAEPASSIEVPFGMVDVRIAFGDLWFTSGAAVVRVDRSTGAVLAEIPVGSSPWGLFEDDRHLWVTVRGEGIVVAIDPETNEIAATVTGLDDPVGAYVDPSTDLVWVADYSGSVSLIDGTSFEEVARIDVGEGADPLAVVGDTAWVESTLASTLSRIRVVRQGP